MIERFFWGAWEWLSHLGSPQIVVLFFLSLLAGVYVTYALAGFCVTHPKSKLTKTLLELCDCDLEDSNPEI